MKKNGFRAFLNIPNFSGSHIVVKASKEIDVSATRNGIEVEPVHSYGQRTDDYKIEGPLNNLEMKIMPKNDDEETNINFTLVEDAKMIK